MTTFGTEHLLAIALGIALILYFIFGGADFGGGTWDLLASGPRKDKQREAISRALGPIWEANHVWLILAVVVLFAGFPRAFQLITTQLHVPLTLFLIGVVFRGSAFVFHQRGWARVFGWASLVSPLFLGMSVAAIASGTLEQSYFTPWTTPFAFVLGLFAVAQCAFLAAVFLAFETRADPELAGDFEKRAFGSGIAVGVLAFCALILARRAAPLLFEGLTGHPLAMLMHVMTAFVALSALWFLRQRNYELARFTAAAQVALVLGGWMSSQYPFVVVPSLTLEAAAGNASARTAIVWALVAGLPVLGPSLWLLFKVFKQERQQQR